MFNNRQGMQQPPPFDWQSVMQQQRPMQPEAPQLPGVGQMRGWQEHQQQDPQSAKRTMLADMLSGMGR